MSISRQMNLLGQQRVDIPHLRALESSIANDFDMAMGTVVGGRYPLIVKGFNIGMTGVVGKPATSLVLTTAGSIAIHYFASESGSLLAVPATQAAETLNALNPNVTGSFVASQTNYVGIDFSRNADSTTIDTVQFLDATALVETAKPVALARTLGYKIVISTVAFSANSNICPVAKVVTDASGNVTSVTDARRVLFRLGSGGDAPNIQNVYPFPAGRSENTSTSTDVFAGGDKTLGSLKDWADAIMTRIWELSGGGDYWYSPTSPQNVKLIKEGAAMAGGDYFTWSGTDLTWQGLRIIFHNAVTSGAFYNIIADQTVTSAGLTNMAIGDCIYVDLVRTSNATLSAVKTSINTLGSPAQPGSRYVLAWRGPSGNVFTRDGFLPVGQSFPPATTTTLGSVKLSGTPASSTAPISPSLDSNSFAQASGLFRSSSSVGGTGSATVLGSAAASGGVGVIIDNASAGTIGAAQTSGTIASVRTGGVEKAFFDFNGSLNISGVPLVQSTASNSGLTVKGNKVAGDTGVDVAINTSVTRTAGKLLSVQNNNVEKASIDVNGVLTAASLSSTALDFAGALSLGTSSATSVNIAKSGVTTTVNGALAAAIGLTVTTGGLTVSAGTTSVGTLSAGATTASSVTSTLLDFAGALSLGTSSATSVSIAKSGVTTTVNGALAAAVSVTTPSVDTSAAATLSIGTGNANAISISKSGTNTTINGGLTVAASQTISMGSNRVTNVATPTASTDAATKAYVDGKVVQTLQFSIYENGATPATAFNYYLWASGLAPSGLGRTTSALGQTAYVLSGNVNPTSVSIVFPQLASFSGTITFSVFRNGTAVITWPSFSYTIGQQTASSNYAFNYGDVIELVYSCTNASSHNIAATLTFST